jgi:hypothetical protein
MSLWLAAGLLTKAYFLAFAVIALATAIRRIHFRPALLSALVVLALAAPWYVRNILLYGNVSGTQEEFGGIGWQQALAAVPKMNWPAATLQLARTSLWTGNNTFFTFSSDTLDLLLILLAIALIAWGARRKAIQSAEKTVSAAVVVFSLAVAYASCASFAYLHGESSAASPWYTQVLLVPVLALAYLGMSRWHRSGIALAGCTVVLWAWVLMATWVAKLFPMYSGMPLAPMRIRDLWSWYLGANHSRDLTLLALAPAPVLYTGLSISLVMTIALAILLIRRLLTSKL